jgi:YVTN family beta-propeller protein
MANTVSVINPVSHTVVKTLNVGIKPNGIAFNK